MKEIRFDVIGENDEEIQFDGVSLSDKQRADLKKNLRVVLGENIGGN